ncbi:hypothetical protein [Glutamicibacter sp. M10]|uniref:hypothetical protein n=1 Tax=Glutamicibacter sp. M10 TaxID=3023076 RepID=UPI0021C93085|nr:hypothetical protein [Glutamicibacter sp. M10]UXN30997.1 hypothetical protein N6V40_11245 [Glutamicibacter sp. M10]
MASTDKLICEISTTDPLQVACQMPDASWIEILSGVGSALGTLVAALAAVYGVYEAFKQRDRADRLDKKNTLRNASGRYFEALSNLVEASEGERFKAGGSVHRELFDFSNLLADGDMYQKRFAESLNIVTGPIINDLVWALEPFEGATDAEKVRYEVRISSARSLIETVAEQAQSAFSVVMNVESIETKEGRVSFFERRATSLASQLTEGSKKDRGNK